MNLSTERALWRQGENADRSTSLPWYYTTGVDACQVLLKKNSNKMKNVGAAPRSSHQRFSILQRLPAYDQKCTAEETLARVGVIRLTLRARVDRRAPRPLFERFVIIPHFFAFVKC